MVMAFVRVVVHKQYMLILYSFIISGSIKQHIYQFTS